MPFQYTHEDVVISSQYWFPICWEYLDLYPVQYDRTVWRGLTTSLSRTTSNSSDTLYGRGNPPRSAVCYHPSLKFDLHPHRLQHPMPVLIPGLTCRSASQFSQSRPWRANIFRIFNVATFQPRPLEVDHAINIKTLQDDSTAICRHLTPAGRF